MRISTVTIYEQSVSSLNRQQSEYLRVGQQIASGRKVVRPSDDPQAASMAVGIQQAKAIDEQFARARVSVRNTLSQEESTLNAASDAISRAKTLLVQAGNGSLSDANRDAISKELKGIYESLIGQANSTDGNGHYLFGGYKDSSPPFQADSNGVVSYVGDNQGHQQQVDSARWIAGVDSGADIFLSVPKGSGFVARAERVIGNPPTTATVDNLGTLTFSGPNVVDTAAAGYGNGFGMTFSVVSGQTYYSIDGGAPQAYQAGQSISYNGLSLSLDGAPADGDKLLVNPADQGNTNLFASLKQAIDVLAAPTDMPEAKAKLQNTMKSVGRELDNSMNNILSVRASIGARLNELDALDSVGVNRTLNYQQVLSDRLDLDYNKAISDYSLRQVGLQAAQKSFVDVQKLSLFNQM
jgi:flagellar hook-associated protein 3 FlgL